MDTELVKRIEEQAVELNRIRQKLEDAQREIADIPKLIEATELNLLRRLSQQAVNCGAYSSCSVVNRALMGRAVRQGSNS